MGSRSALFFVAPILAYPSLKERFSGKRRTERVRTTVTVSETAVEITFFGVVITKKDKFSKRCMIPKDGIQDYSADARDGTLVLLFNGLIDWLNGKEEVVQSSEVLDEELEFSAPPEIYSALCQVIETWENNSENG